MFKVKEIFNFTHCKMILIFDENDKIQILKNLREIFYKKCDNLENVTK